MELQSILNKLSQIQATINVAKNQKNSFGNYNYRSCEDILQAMQPYCEKLGVVILLSDEIKELLNGWVYVEATAKIVDCETQEEISVKAQAGIQERKGMDLSQTFGASSSYARKYALNGLLKLDDNKDADTDAFTKKIKEIEKQETSENKPLKVEVKEIKAEEKKTPKKAQKQSDNDFIETSELPFEKFMGKFTDAHKEETDIELLENLKEMVNDRLLKIVGDNGERLRNAYNYYATNYGKNNFDELEEKDLRNIIADLDKKLEKRA